MKKPAKTTPNLQLKRVRECQGLSQEDVGQEIGTDAFTVSRWERGVTMPSPHFRQKLSTLFGLSIAELGLVPKDEYADQIAISPVSFPLPQAQILDPAILPPPAGEHGLVGRDELLRNLKQRLLDGKHIALGALNGLPGVGKTALATALAHDEEVRAKFSDGILWAGLGYEPDVLGQLSRWGTLLNCVPTDLAQRSRPEAWAKNIHAAIRQQHMLLVIDDAWEIADALAFQVGGSHCAHLVTTRFPEIARRFAADGVVVVRELDDADGRLLLMRLAPEVVDAEPEEARALVAAVGGLPLALTLLGNFLRAQAYSGQPRRLRVALERLRSSEGRLRLSEPQALVGGHPSLSVGAPLSLQAVIGISDQQMSKDARAALRALAVFPPKPNTFSEEAAIAVSAMPVETLDVLTDAGLLECSGPEHYMLHQTIADYARAHLTDATVAERLVSYFVAFVEAHATDYTVLERESGNILAALEAALERGMLPAFVRGVHAFACFLITRGLYAVAEAHLQRSLAAARTLEDVPGQTTAWLHLGKIAEQRGNYAQAQEYWQNGLTLAHQNGQRSSEAQMLRELGDLAWEQGQPQQARQFLVEALDTLRQLEDQRGVADTLKSLGNLAADQGQPEQARQFYDEALELFRQQGDQRGAAITLHNLGILAREQGQPEQARQLYDEALNVLRQLGDQRSTAVVLSNLGNLARQQGQLEQARQFLEESLIIHRHMENRRAFAFTLSNLGNVAVEQGQFAQAHQLFKEALPILRDMQARRNIAITLQGQGILAREQGQFGQAHQSLDEALTIFQDLQDRRNVAFTQREQALLAQLQGLPELAHQLLTEALATLDQLGDQYEVAITRQKLGVLMRQQGRLEEAYDLLTQVLTTMRQVRDRRNVAHTLKEIGVLTRQQRRLEEALYLLLKAKVGLELVASPDMRVVEEMLEQVRTQVGEGAFISTARQVSTEIPEPAYGLSQMEWTSAVLKVATQIPAN